ncbi:phage major capsid protein [Paraburkholderia mimosarum]|uniref:phage major capsid protein n=1 Tax=Paraburkholderia mimosarum TaxID=312026 RepID=UPI0039C13768
MDLIAEIKQALAERDQHVDGLLTKSSTDLAALIEKVKGLEVNGIDLAQKLAGLSEGGMRGGGGSYETPGQAFIKSFDADALREHKSGSSGKVPVPSFFTKAAGDITTAQAGSAATPANLNGLSWTPRVMSAFTFRGFDASMAVYPRVTGVTNAAAAVAELAAKPETQIDATLITETVPTIAHWVRTSKQVLDDAASLSLFIDSVLRVGVLQKADAQVAAALLAMGKAVTAPTGSNMLDAAIYAAASMADLGRQATAAIFSTTDYLNLVCSKDANGRYLFDSLSERLPIAITYSGAITAGQVLVVDGSSGAILERQQPTVEVGLAGNDFVENALTIRGEARLLLAQFDTSGVAIGSVEPAAPLAAKSK